jgi:hypothetical protein
VADVNGDGLLDVFFACANDPTAGQRNRLFFNTTAGGAASFLEVTATNLPVIRDDSEDCEFLDFDLDGDQDIVIANVDGSLAFTPFGQGGDYILVNQGFAQAGVEGNFLAPIPNPIPALEPGDTSESLDVAVGDIDADGFPDLFFSDWAVSPTPGNYTTPAVAGQDRLLLRRIIGGVPAYEDRTAALLPLPATFGTDAEIFDVDFDGDQDIVTALGSLGGTLVAIPATANIGRGAPMLINLGITPGTQIPFGPRVPIPAVNLLDFRDVEHGDWREAASAGGFGRYFEKDMGCATIGAGATLTTLDHQCADGEARALRVIPGGRARSSRSAHAGCSSRKESPESRPIVATRDASGERGPCFGGPPYLAFFHGFGEHDGRGARGRLRRPPRGGAPG